MNCSMIETDVFKEPFQMQGLLLALDVGWVFPLGVADNLTKLTLNVEWRMATTADCLNRENESDLIALVAED